MALLDVISRIEPIVASNIRPLNRPYPLFTVFLSVSDGRSRARVFHASADTFSDAWHTVVGRCLAGLGSSNDGNIWLRVDWVSAVQPLQLGQLRECLKTFKRNYFRYGLALDESFEIAFIEQELNANAMLYGGVQCPHAYLNEKNFTRYARKRFGLEALAFSDADNVFMLTTGGAFCANDEQPQLLYPSGRSAGRRKIVELKPDTLLSLIHSGSGYLASQVQGSGRFHYGWHPCFDRSINTYNSLRHASTLYAMLEAWEITGDATLMASVELSMGYLLAHLVKKVRLENNEAAAFVIDLQDEIKLGANAVCILMLVKYTELTGSGDYLELLDALAQGILFMQDQQSGRFVHVLNYPDLTIKESFRVIYYNGEAAFALMRLYKLTADQRWLNAVEKAFEHFIAEDYWQYHDHWLSYCVNELTLYRPDERYYRFGIMNVADYLDFVEKRMTTFPTLLELMMATKAMIDRLQRQPEFAHLLREINLDKFEKALKARAIYLLNGYFWPEFAMFFQNPDKIVGSFFIRHHAFRIRIDDVEHYLSGYVAYLKHLRAIPGSSHQSRRAMSTQTPEPHAIDRSCKITKLKNFTVDIRRLRDHFIHHVKPRSATLYADHLPDYVGWAVTSRDGSLSDGIKPENEVSKEGMLETEICCGYLAGLLTALKIYGLCPYRVRIMRLDSGDVEIPFQADSPHGEWQLYIPIETSVGALFQWVEPDGAVESVHFLADGTAWLVQVDGGCRVFFQDEPLNPNIYLVMNLRNKPVKK